MAAAAALIQLLDPDGHLALAAVRPCIIRNESCCHWSRQPLRSLAVQSAVLPSIRRIASNSIRCNDIASAKQILVRLRLKLAISWNIKLMQVGSIICFFQAVDEWTSLECDSTCRVSHKRMTSHPVNRHSECKF